MSKKGEARIARKLAQELKTKAKSVRLLAEPDGHVVRSEYVLEERKQVRTGADPGSIYNLTFTWTIEHADRDGVWGSGIPREWGEENWNGLIEPKLTEFAKLTWSEVERMVTDTGRRMHHPMDTDQIIGEAQQRLTDIQRVSESIYRFRLGNLPRLWGFRVVGEFQILWYDPEHKIYPTG